MTATRGLAAALLALGFAAVVAPIVAAERWAGGGEAPAAGEPAAVSVRVAPFAGTRDGKVAGGGVVVARGVIASEAQHAAAVAVVAARPAAAPALAALVGLLVLLAGLASYHLRRSPHGARVRVQAVGFAAVALLAAAAQAAMLLSAVSVLVVPVALLAVVPALAFDRVVGLATGLLAAAVVALVIPFDAAIAMLLVVQAAVAALVVPRAAAPGRALAIAGALTAACTVAAFAALAALTRGALPPASEPLWLAAALGPLLAALLARVALPAYQRLTGELTAGQLAALDDRDQPALRDLAARDPAAWQHALLLARLVEPAARAIGADPRRARVAAYYREVPDAAVHHTRASREAAVAALCGELEIASRTWKRVDPADIDAAVARAVHASLGTGLTADELGRVAEAARGALHAALRSDRALPSTPPPDALAATAEQPATPSLARTIPGPAAGPPVRPPARRSAQPPPPPSYAELAIVETAPILASAPRPPTITRLPALIVDDLPSRPASNEVRPPPADLGAAIAEARLTGEHRATHSQAPLTLDDEPRELPTDSISRRAVGGGRYAIEDAGATAPSMPRFERPTDQRSPFDDPPLRARPPGWSADLASRVDNAIERQDEWGAETPVVAPSRAELRALLGVPDPTRQQSIDELEALHRQVEDLASEPEILQRRPASRTAEVDPDDIEAAIELAPPARRPPTSVGFAKPKKPE